MSEDFGRISLRHKEDNDGETDTGKDGKNPIHPSPVCSGNLDETGDDRTDRRTDERS